VNTKGIIDVIFLIEKLQIDEFISSEGTEILFEILFQNINVRSKKIIFLLIF
jgi:hypothetical protein